MTLRYDSNTTCSSNEVNYPVRLEDLLSPHELTWYHLLEPNYSAQKTNLLSEMIQIFYKFLILPRTSNTRPIQNQLQQHVGLNIPNQVQYQSY